MTTRSGWCSPSFGLPHTRRQHVACRSAVCGCEEFGGHEKPVVDRDSASKVLASAPSMWENESGPEGASTPESPGLTCITRRNRGARL